MIQAAAPAPAQARPGVTPQVPSQASPRSGAPAGAGPPIGMTGTPQAQPVSGTQITAAYVAGLRATARELQDQRQAAVNLKRNIASQLRDASAAEAPGLQERIKIVDARIIALEQQITDNGRELAAMPGELLARTAAQPPDPSGGPSPDQITAILIVGTIFVLAPLSIAFARLLWKRATRWGKPMPLAPEITQRLDNLSQGMEAIAIEVERISEGQRFVTNLVGENARRALGAGEPPAEPIHVRVPEGARARE